MGKVLRLIKLKSWEVYFEAFLLQKQLEGLRPRTLNDYRYYIPRFFEGVTLENTETITHRVKECFTQDLSPASFNLRRSYIKSFFSYLLSQGAIAENPINFPKRKEEGRARAIPKETLERLLELPDKKTFAGLRNYTLILLSLDTGIRPGEALKLLPKDFNLGGREVAIPKEVAKTKTSRTLPLSPVVCVAIQKLLSSRHPTWGDGVPVFCSQDGEPLRVRSWSHILARYSKKLGVRITPYDLRHSFAILYLRNGGNVFALQRTMGHTDLNMTKRYLALSEDDLRNELEKSSPINSLIKPKKRVR
ncbi:site-specific integrase [Candidatus Bathyarchaeota archaeon]|nr:site-specific integrase [Candidatus Bathyarchaeota archaeon]